MKDTFWHTDKFTGKGKVWHMHTKFYTGMNIHFVVGINGQGVLWQLHQITKEPLDDIVEMMDSHAFCYGYYIKGVLHNIIVVSDWAMRIAVHEITHAMWTIDHHHEFKSSFDNQEAFAYGCDWLVGEFQTMAKNKAAHQVQLPIIKKPVCR